MAILGNNTIGGTPQAANPGFPTYAKFVAASSFGANIVAIYAAANSVDIPVTFGIYADSGGVPGALLGTTAEFTPITTTPGWYFAAFPSPVTITNGSTYWLCKSHGTNQLNVYYDAGSFDSRFSTFAYVAGTVPSSSPGTNAWFSDKKFSIFATDATSLDVVPGTASLVSYGLTVASVAVGAASLGTAPYTYQWYRSLTPGFTPGGGNIVGGATSLTLNDTGLTRGVTYYYKNVVTDDDAGTATSNEISFTTRTKQVVDDGDSITSGFGLGVGQSWPSQSQAILGDTWQIDNTAIQSQTLAEMQATRTDVDAKYSAANSANVAVCAGGTNDIFFNADGDLDDTGATTYARILTWCAASRAAGFKVVVTTLLPRDDFSASSSTLPGNFAEQKAHHEARRTSVNALIRANRATFADALADIAADSRIGDDGDENNGTYYQLDKVHPTAAGSLVIAEIESAAILAAAAGGPYHYEQALSGGLSALGV